MDQRLDLAHAKLRELMAVHQEHPETRNHYFTDDYNVLQQKQSKLETTQVLAAAFKERLWASGYEIYDRLSSATAAYLEGLTAIHDASHFETVLDHLGQPLREGARGSELNQSTSFRAIHPVIRTNPVMGWKSVFVNKGFTKRIVELTKDESDVILEYLFKLIAQNHNNQVRFRWRKNGVAIWDNRSNFHSGTYDHNDVRIGDRVVSLGAAPYYDPASSSRKAALGKEGLPIRTAA